MQKQAYLVKLKLVSGDIEKSSLRLVEADNEREAGIAAMEAEANYNLDFSDYPDGDGCWDGAEWIYTVRGTKRLTTEQAQAYRELITF